jgi:Zn-dependent metalloprotease
MGKIAPVASLSAQLPRAAATPVELYTYDAKQSKDIRLDPSATNDRTAKSAFENVSKVRDYYKTTFGRDGWDGKGGVSKVVVHSEIDGTSPMSNAYWTPDKKTLEFGDGGDVNGDNKRDFLPLGNGLDVVAHEFTHGVVESSVRLSDTGQGGGLNESWADVLGSGIDKNWKIGETIFTPGVKGDAIRDMEHPSFYDHISKIPPSESEPHLMSEVPSYAAVKVANAIGPDKMRQVWYTGLTEHMRSNSGYSGAARATLEAAAQLYGKDGTEFNAVKDAWKAVGVDARWTKNRRATLDKAAMAFTARTIPQQ